MTFVVQDTDERPWRRVIDTSLESPHDLELARPCLLARPSYMLAGHSVVVSRG